MNDLNGKVSIITGGTSGIGAACAFRFSSVGAKVVIAGRNIEKGNEIVKKIKENGGEAIFVEYEAMNLKDAKKLVQMTIDKYENIDILLNNAGVFFTGDFDKISLSEWEKVFKIDVEAVYYLIQQAMPYLIKNKGVILNNASVAGMQSYAKGKSYAYSAAKSAVIQLTRMIALNYGADVRANCICPGIIKTPMWIRDDLEIYGERIPMRKIGTPDDVAKVANFLVSSDAEYLNGVVVPVDGGASL